MAKHPKSEELLSYIRDGKPMSVSQRLSLTIRLAFPAMVAQMSSIVMQYIDAAMVGSLGAEPSASIGLVSTTTWLFSGVCSAVVAGFSVQVAHYIGANEFRQARQVLREALTFTLAFAVMLSVCGVLISGHLPLWLGGGPSIIKDAGDYFRIYSLFLPLLQLSFLSSSMLRYSGNMKMPSVMGILMCVLDVIFNFFFIFPGRDMVIGGRLFTVPGLGLGVKGAALGTGAAIAVVAFILLLYMVRSSGVLKLAGERGSFIPASGTIVRSLHIGLPMGFEHILLCGAQIIATTIVAPLGVVAIAANSLAVTAESLCYMPGYGIADAATTLVGQSLGARRPFLAKRFAYITVGNGMLVMTLMGVVMYLLAPEIIGFMTVDEGVKALGAEVLRIEAFAEPMFAASIVSYSVFVGAADTLAPCLMNLASMWGVRLTLAAYLAPRMGLRGVWVAMCIELCFRGFIFLVRLFRQKWLKRYEGNKE